MKYIYLKVILFVAEHGKTKGFAGTEAEEDVSMTVSKYCL